jgi:glycosyltransferase involved in cell wall biosynthesis
MKILYDGLFYLNQRCNNQRAGGIGRYFENIINRLPLDCSPFLTSPEPFEFCFPKHPQLRCYYPPQKVFGSRRLAGLTEGFRVKAIEQRGGFNLAHPTYYGLMSGNSISSYKMPVVITVYDMILERFASELDPQGAETARKLNAVQAADAVICISESTKRDLMEILRIPEERIVVTPLATGLSFSGSDDASLVPRKPYIFFVGSRAFYKNFLRLLLAFAKISDAWPDLNLIVSGVLFNQTEKELMVALGIKTKVIHVSQSNDSQLASLYHNAEAFIYPSLYEGFGIPPLEAMTCKTIVIAANSSSIPEVVGDAAMLFDPYSVEELAGRIFELKNLGSRRNDYIKKGLERVAQFSWDATAAKTFEVYKQTAR